MVDLFIHSGLLSIRRRAFRPMEGELGSCRGGSVHDALVLADVDPMIGEVGSKDVEGA